MKVCILPQFSGKDTAQGGIRRVYEAQHQYFPDLGINIVDTPGEADLVACHATEDTDHPIIVNHNHGLYWDGYKWAAWAHKANRKLVELAKKAQVVTTPSEWVANVFRRGMLIEPTVLPHGINLDEWTPGEKAPYVLWAKTRPDPICNPDDMNKLATMASDTQFVSTFGRVDGNVAIIEALPFPEIKKFIQSAQIYLATTMETGGITILEAMASGTVPLGWKWGANTEIVEHKETGYLAEPGNFEDLLEGLRYCQANYKTLSGNARQVVEKRFQWHHVIGKYKDTYEQALESPQDGPMVSVIVTAYNLEEYLPACIESVLEQDFRDWELIIVNDNSPDNCGAIAEQYAEKDSRIKVIHNKQNVYLAEARNIAIRQSSGRYIMPLDADDKLGFGGLKLLTQALQKDREYDIVTGAMRVVEPDGVTPWSQLAKTNGVSGWPPDKPLFNAQIQHRNQVPYASMYRRWVWERTGGYRRRYRTAEDADFWTRAMSYGAVPAKVTKQPTLVYTNRSDSMSHQEGAINWTSWFTWAKYPELAPFSASGIPPKGEIFWSVPSYEPVKISIVIPVGPGHDWFLQDALDSLVAQTFQDFECVVVNDTGEAWYDGETLVNPYVAGFPWAKVIDSEGPAQGVAWARTTGTLAAKAPLVFYLDADDYLQPAALDVYYKVQKKYGGWVYSDWFDQDMTHKVAEDWDADKLPVKMLGPMTGLYPREAMLSVLFEEFGGWEDWDAQLSLLEKGICGTRIAKPLFVYRYHTGTRREDSFEKADNLVQYIRNKHKNLFKEDFMARCRSCGGGGGKPRITVGTTSRQQQEADMEKVLVEFIGPATQFQRVKSKVKRGRQYKFGGNPGADTRKFFVYKDDAEWMLLNRQFRLVPITQQQTTVEDLPVVESHTRPAPVMADWGIEKPPVISLNKLNLAPEIISIVENTGIDCVEQLQGMSTAQLVSIKGIGPARAAQIIEAVTELLGN